MDKIKNTKEKFYLFKKHFINDGIEDLIKYTNKSMIRLFKIKKEEEKEKKEEKIDKLLILST